MLRYRIPIDPCQPLVTVTVRSNSPNVSGGCGGHAIKSAAETGERRGDAAPVCSIPVLGLPVITHRPNVVGGDGIHRMEIFVNVSRIRDKAPAGSVPMIRQRIISVAIEVSGLGIAHGPDIIGRDG